MKPRRTRPTVTLICALAFAIFPLLAAASEYHGQVTFGGFPVPGATITATQGKKNFTTTTDQGGLYNFTDLPDGTWKIEIEMQCFSAIQAEVNVTPQTPAAEWELTLQPLDKIMARSKLTELPFVQLPTVNPPTAKKTEASSATAVDIPKPPSEANEQAADGFLVNGSVSNAATSQFALTPAFGNRRFGSKALYNGGFAAIFDNAALDARPYSLSGQHSPKASYDRFTGVFTLGGPIKIPHVLPRGPTFFFAYQGARDHNAAIESGLVPTAAQRAGDLSGVLNALGQPVTIYNPATGQPFAGNIVPVSPQAEALLALYRQPNVTGNSRYNYQVAVLNSIHQDALQLRLDKTVGRKDQLYGGFNLQSTRAASTNLFGFVDATDSLGINTNVNWSHRFSQHLFLFATYKFSRLRTLLTPNFAHRQDVSAAAGISGNDQDPTNWGPPALNFSSGIATLSDAQSAFNRARTDSFSVSAQVYRGHHNITVGGDFRKQQYNDFFQQDPRGTFTFTGAATQGAATSAAATGSDFADFLIGVPDTSSIAFGNADKYLRQPAYDAYATDDWRIISTLTINAGARWEYEAPITELHGRLVNLDVAPDFSSAAPVLANHPIGPLTGNHYPTSLVQPDKLGVEPRIGISWRPIPASTVVVRAGYGVYRDTSVYQSTALQLSQQAPLSKSLSVQNSAACPLTLANGFNACSSTTADTFAIDPNFRVGYAHTWQLSVQRDMPAALQLTATYLGVKGTRGVQEFLPNTYPIGATNPCPSCPSGFAYRTSGGDSTRHSGQLQLRRRLRSGFTASLLYTFSKSLDDDASLGGQGYHTTSQQNQDLIEAPTSPTFAVAQNWRNPHAERALSSFDQRHLLNLQAQYTTGEGLGGGDLMRGWAGRLMKEWSILAQINAGTGLPETPIYLAAVPGAGLTAIIRPDPTGTSIYKSGAGLHLNAAGYTVPLPGQWGTAGRNSIIGPGQFSLNTSLARTFRPSTRFFLDARIDAANVLNHGVFTGWNTIINSTQFGVPVAANPMRSLQTTLRLRF